ncbi:MAG TPA: LamG-like jellyroll fold domain-containing protein [Puia sp.]|nr:LamG-like jellyroll fold domain-containing protein [Puia sp.]
MVISACRKLLPLFAMLTLSFVSRSQCFTDALRFNRSQQQFATLPPNLASSLTADFTIEAWVYPTSNLSFLQSESIVSLGNNANDFMTLALFSGNNSPVFSLDVNGTEDDIITGTKVTINTWHQIAVVSSGGTATLYLDGHSIGSTTLSNTPSSLGGGSGTTDDWLGKSEFASDPTFSGYMDEFRISDDARYTANFTPPSSPFTPDGNTIDLYHFDDGSGQTITDASGNGNNGVLGATAATESTDPTWQNCATLPIFLTGFTALLQNNIIHLQWTAYKDVEPGSFAIQKSTDGKDFTTIGTIEANEPEGEYTYRFDDPNPVNGNNFYRLLIADQGSTDKYSNILLVTVNHALAFNVFPTLATSSVTIEIANASKLTLIDARGAAIQQLNLSQSQVIDISFLAKGLYFLVNKETGQVARFIKN